MGERRIGRPTKAPKAGERIPLSLTVPAETKRKLLAAADKTKRSLSQEAEFRLEQSFSNDAAFGSAELRGTAIRMAIAFNAAGSSMAYGAGIKGDWMQNPDCYLAAARGVAVALWLSTPEGARDADKAKMFAESFMGIVTGHYLNEARKR
jgi:hypothetical protein